ncbi:13508_t:CDS:2 [Dentiscutata erythropus]|uniref:13508_t:CDS:1 n=1 Tax=Dentiscutata erythropus TaxID=1348616 RepID=A0A9N8YRR9_9GLOM|nr:13508_t:CDS:2 [Dentiscutata erythropus]
MPNPELPKDFLSHEQFWARTGFEDPYTKLEQEDFAKCDHECSDEIHQKSIDDLLPEKSYCDLQLVATFHIIFVLDRSGSMGCSDHPPTSDTLFGKTLALQGIHNNRFDDEFNDYGDSEEGTKVLQKMANVS